MKKILYTFIIAALVFGFSGCNIFEGGSTSNSILELISLTGTDLEGNTGSEIHYCDVTENGTVFNDEAQATFIARLIDPAIETGTFYQAVTIDQVDVSYTRSDGRNEEGEDVPYAFSQKVNLTIEIGEEGILIFVLIRHEAKTESPLAELYSQSEVLQFEAHCTFHAHDGGGHRLEPLEATITVYAADYGDA